ncbi:MAG: hypothetical protein ACTSRB_13380 [Candidatus Helarchaeota archaeon]
MTVLLQQLLDDIQEQGNIHHAFENQATRISLVYSLKKLEHYSVFCIFILKDAGHVESLHDRNVREIINEVEHVKKLILAGEISALRLPDIPRFQVRTLSFFDLRIHDRLRLQHVSLEHDGKPVLTFIFPVLITNVPSIHRTLACAECRLDLVPAPLVSEFIRNMNAEIVEKSAHIYDASKDRHVQWNNRVNLVGMILTLVFAGFTTPLMILAPFFKMSPLFFIDLYWMLISFDAIGMIGHAILRHKAYLREILAEWNHPQLFDIARGSNPPERHVEPNIEKTDLSENIVDYGQVRDEIDDSKRNIHHGSLTRTSKRSIIVPKKANTIKKQESTQIHWHAFTGEYSLIQTIRKEYESAKSAQEEKKFRIHFLNIIQGTVAYNWLQLGKKIPKSRKLDPVENTLDSLARLQARGMSHPYKSLLQQFLEVLSHNRSLFAEEMQVMLSRLEQMLIRLGVLAGRIEKQTPISHDDESSFPLNEGVINEDLTKIPDLRVQRYLNNKPKTRCRKEQIEDMLMQANRYLHVGEDDAIKDVLKGFPGLLFKEVLINSANIEENRCHTFEQIFKKKGVMLTEQQLLKSISSINSALYEYLKAFYKDFQEIQAKKKAPGETLYKICQQAWKKMSMNLYASPVKDEFPIRSNEIGMEEKTQEEKKLTPIIPVTDKDIIKNELKGQFIEIKTIAKLNLVLNETSKDYPICIVSYRSTSMPQFVELLKIRKEFRDLMFYLLNVEELNGDDDIFQVVDSPKTLLKYRTLKYTHEYVDFQDCHDLLKKFMRELNDYKHSKLVKSGVPINGKSGPKETDTTTNSIEEIFDPNSPVIHIKDERPWLHHIRHNTNPVFVLLHYGTNNAYIEALNAIKTLDIPNNITIIEADQRLGFVQETFPEEVDLAILKLDGETRETLSIDQLRGALEINVDAVGTKKTPKKEENEDVKKLDVLKFKRIVVDGTNVFNFIKNDLQQFGEIVDFKIFLKLRELLYDLGFEDVIIYFDSNTYHNFSNKENKQLNKLIKTGRFRQSASGEKADPHIITMATGPIPGYILSRDKFWNYDDDFQTRSSEFIKRLIAFEITDGLIHFEPKDKKLANTPIFKKRYKLFDAFEMGIEAISKRNKNVNEKKAKKKKNYSKPNKSVMNTTVQTENEPVEKPIPNEIKMHACIKALSFLRQNAFHDAKAFKKRFENEYDFLLGNEYIIRERAGSSDRPHVNITTKGIAFVKRFFIVDIILGEFDPISGPEIIYPTAYNTGDFANQPLAGLETRASLKKVLQNCFDKHSYLQSFQDELQEFNLIYRTWKIKNNALPRGEAVFGVLIFCRKLFNEEFSHAFSKELKQVLNGFQPTLDYRSELVEFIQKIGRDLL